MNDDVTLDYHHEPSGFSDRFAFALVRFTRFLPMCSSPVAMATVRWCWNPWRRYPAWSAVPSSICVDCVA
jgi:hypothetical protein